MALIIPNTFSNGFPAIATEVNANFSAVKAFVDAIQTGVNIDAGAITNAQLATISTAGKVLNTATTATSANTANAIVARDASGNFTAGTITANVTGNVSGSSGSCTGNAATATNVAYSGLTGAVPTWNQNTTGNAATATTAGTATYVPLLNLYPTVVGSTGVALNGLKCDSVVVLLGGSGGIVGTFNHGLGVTPTGVIITGGDTNANAGFAVVNSITSTQVTFSYFFGTPNANCRINYIAFG